jgi:hypothetical protein
VREDLGHLLRREGVHGVGVDVALFKDVDVEGGRRIFVRRLSDREEVVLALQPESFLDRDPGFRRRLLCGFDAFGAFVDILDALFGIFVENDERRHGERPTGPAAG